MSAPAVWKLSSAGAVENRHQARFLAPFEGHNTAEFTIAAAGRWHSLTWLMHGPAPFISKVMQVFMNIDNMVGKDFEVGLANLKKLAE